MTYAQAVEPADSVAISQEHQEITSDNKPAFPRQELPEQLNSDPNDLDQPIAGPLDTLLPADPNAQSSPALEEPQKYWQPQYHPQVDQRTFMILNFPYYHNGRDYPVGQWQQFYLHDEWMGLYNEPNEIAVGVIGGTTLNIDKVRFDMEDCCDMIHQWRSINELPQTALEIVRAVELTKTNTQIYSRKPELAVRVKRTVGQIGRVNKHFDLISRTTMQAILMGQTDKIYLSRMRKQIADLVSYLDRLAAQNDQISVELGVGKIDRSAAAASDDRRIDYSNSVIIEDK